VPTSTQKYSLKSKQTWLESRFKITSPGPNNYTKFITVTWPKWGGLCVWNLVSEARENDSSENTRGGCTTEVRVRPQQLLMPDVDVILGK
jgi:hypothetical protein